MKKIIAMLLMLCVSSSLIPTSFAEDAASLEISDIKLINEQSLDELGGVPTKKPTTSVLPIDPEDGSYMIYMDDTYANNHTFAPIDFLGDGTTNPSYSAIAWPPKLRDQSKRTGLPVQQATINNQYNTLTSLRSNITYKLPERNASGSAKVDGSEVAMLDIHGWNSGLGTNAATDILVYDKVDKIHFLLATSCNSENAIRSVGVYVNYDDGSSTFPPQWGTGTSYGPHSKPRFNETVDQSYALGDNGYLCVNLPLAKNQNNEHFVADFENYYCKTPGYKADYTGNFVKDSPDSTTTVAAYEYSIDVDENKTITDIVFAQEFKNPGINNAKKSGVVLLGMAYEYSEDDSADDSVKGRIESVNESIARIAASGANADMDQIIDTTNEMIKLKEEGYGKYLYFNEETGFSSDNNREITTVSKNTHFNVTFTAKNPTASAAEMCLISAYYDENNTLVEANKTDVTIPAYQKKSKFSENVRVPDKDFSYARFYIWNKEIAPYGARIFDTEDDIFTQVNFSDYANGKFYANADRLPAPSSGQNPVELKLPTYNNKANFGGYFDFAGITGDLNTKTAAYYPLQTKEDKIEILDPNDGLLHSKLSDGVKYAMPQKREGVHNKEVVTISNKDENYTSTIKLENDIYEKIHFIVSSSNEAATKLRAIVNFTDGSREVNYVDICKQDDTENEHCIANLYNVSSVDDTGFKTANNVNLLMLEYSIDINNPKVADSITFELIEKERLDVVPTKPIGNVVITAITTQRRPYLNAKDLLSARINGYYSEEEADALGEIVTFLNSKEVDCSDLDIPSSSGKARQVFISADADASVADGTIDNPFATVEDACTHIRSNASYMGDWEVLFREGTYVVTETITLNEETLPGATSITFKPYNNERVEFTGNTLIDMSKATLAYEINSRLPSAAQGKVVQINLKDQGITNVAPYALVKYQQKRTPASRIIIDDAAYNVARWPNEGTAEQTSFAAIGTVTDAGTASYGKTFVVKSTSGSNIGKWNNAKNAILQGFFSDNNWDSNSFNFSSTGTYYSWTTVTSNDTDFKVYTANTNKRFFIENLLEEIDVPGEWYIDHDTNTLYIYPLDGEHKYSISTLDGYIFDVSNLNNIHIEDLHFNGGVGGAISFLNTNNSEIKGCDIRNFTSKPIQLKICKNSGVVACDMSMLGGGAIYIEEPTIQYSNTDSEAYVTDCKIENCSTYSRTGGKEGAVISIVGTTGTKITNNKISNATSQAISGGFIKNASIKYNDISYVQKEYGDAGAIYFGQSFLTQGNEISNNYIHDINPYGSVLLLAGIYLDDLCSGFEIKNNIIKNVETGMLLGGGKNITVENNLISESQRYSIEADVRGVDWDTQAGAPTRRTELVSLLQNNPLFRFKYPHTMGDYYLDNETEFTSGNKTDKLYLFPANNSIKNNFCYKKNHNISTIWKDTNLNNTLYHNIYALSGAPSDFLKDSNGNLKFKDTDLKYIKSWVPGFISIESDKIGLINKR